MAVLVKNAKTKVALENKHRYDTKYESSPDRVKYREELNQERRKRGIMGGGGPDISHTSANTVTLENPHDNRARHFKERGTFKPIEKAWNNLSKEDLPLRNSPEETDEQRAERFRQRNQENRKTWATGQSASGQPDQLREWRDRQNNPPPPQQSGGSRQGGRRRLPIGPPPEPLPPGTKVEEDDNVETGEPMFIAWQFLKDYVG